MQAEGWTFPDSCAQRGSPCWRNFCVLWGGFGLTHGVLSPMLGHNQQHCGKRSAKHKEKFKELFHLFMEETWLLENSSGLWKKHADSRKGSYWAHHSKRHVKMHPTLCLQVCRTASCTQSEACMLSTFLIHSQKFPKDLCQAGYCCLSLNSVVKLSV